MWQSKDNIIRNVIPLTAGSRLTETVLPPDDIFLLLLLLLLMWLLMLLLLFFVVLFVAVLFVVVVVVVAVDAKLTILKAYEDDAENDFRQNDDWFAN